MSFLQSGTAYISTSQGPIQNHNILRIPGICAICIHRFILRARRGIHIEVCHGDILGMRNESVPILGVSFMIFYLRAKSKPCLPKLSLFPCDTINEEVCRLPEIQVNWTAVLIASILIFVAPLLTIAI
jgi:hypothetical protein